MLVYDNISDQEFVMYPQENITLYEEISLSSLSVLWLKCDMIVNETCFLFHFKVSKIQEAMDTCWTKKLPCNKRYEEAAQTSQTVITIGTENAE